MNAKEQMKTVNNITDEIAESLGKLTRHGVLSFNDAMDIMQIINTSQVAWMNRNFTEEEINEFASSL